MTAGRGRQKTAAIAIAASLALMPLESATAHRFRASSSSSINAFKRKFQGRVKSPTGRCKRGRTVTVFQKKAGPDKRIGSDTSARSGAWTVGKRPQNGKRYYAKVKYRKKKRHGHSHICKQGRSRTITR